MENSSPAATISNPGKWFLTGKTTVKKWVLIKPEKKIFHGGVWGGGDFLLGSPPRVNYSETTR